jgi:type II secretory pathway pseudopilin PulG
VVLLVIGIVLVLLLIALPLAKRREARKGRRPHRSGDIGAAIRAGKEQKIHLQLADRRRRRR